MCVSSTRTATDGCGLWTSRWKRCITEAAKDLDAVLDAILRVLARHRQSAAKAEPLKFVRRGGE
jgi:hypothetical protein